MESASFGVDPQPDGTAAIAALESDAPYDLILLDIMMPGASGLEVLSHLRGLEHRKSTPVVILTAKGRMQTASKRSRSERTISHQALQPQEAPCQNQTRSSTAPDPHLYITVLAGGVGSRFWPASTSTRPKQLLPLASTNPLIVDTLDRARCVVPTTGSIS